MVCHVLDPDGLSGSRDHPCDRRSVSEAVGLSVLAAAVYTLEPGESLAAYHYHDEREEVFYVVSGELLAETPGRDYRVPVGGVLVVEPGTPFRPYNPEEAEEPARVLGIGAPAYDIAHEYDPTDNPGDGSH